MHDNSVAESIPVSNCDYSDETASLDLIIQAGIYANVSDGQASDFEASNSIMAEETSCVCIYDNIERMAVDLPHVSTSTDDTVLDSSMSDDDPIASSSSSYLSYDDSDMSIGS